MRVGGTILNALKEGGTKKRGGETKIFKRQANWVKRMGALKKGGRNPLWNYDNTNYNLLDAHRQLGIFPIFSQGQFVDSFLILFAVFWSVTSFFAVCVCKNSIKTPSYSMEKYQKLPNEFFWYQHRKLFSNHVQVNNL